MQDMTGQPCNKKRCSGIYKETTFHDDMDGTLHCSRCNNKIERYKRMKSIEVTILTHFSKDDTDCSGDYYDIEIIINDKVVMTYNDYYHDKGEEKATGFIDGLQYLSNNKYKVEYREIADR